MFIIQIFTYEYPYNLLYTLSRTFGPLELLDSLFASHLLARRAALLRKMSILPLMLTWLAGSVLYSTTNCCCLKAQKSKKKRYQNPDSDTS